MLKYLSIFIICIMFSSNTFSQSFGNITYLRKHGIIGMNSLDESYKKTEKNLYKFELSRNKIIYWKGPIRFEFDVEKITDTRFFIKGKPWIIKIVEDGKALIWIWGNDNDTVFTNVYVNNLNSLKSINKKPLKHKL